MRYMISDLVFRVYEKNDSYPLPSGVCKGCPECDGNEVGKEKEKKRKEKKAKENVKARIYVEWWRNYPYSEGKIANQN